MGFTPDSQQSSGSGFTPDAPVPSEPQTSPILEKVSNPIVDAVASPFRASNQAAGGMREAIRSIGTGEDMADAYMRGFTNPGKSETFQEEFTRKAVNKTPGGPVNEIQAGISAGALGMASDILTNPVDALSVAMFEKFPTLLKQVAPGIESRISQFLTKERHLPKFGTLDKPGSLDIQEMIKQASQETAGMATQLDLSKKAELSKIRQDYVVTKNGLDTKISSLDNEVIPKAADKSTTTLRNKYWDYAKDLSNRFGAAWERAIAGEKIQTQQLYDAIGRAIEKDGFMARQPDPNKWSSSQKSIYEYWQKIGEQLPSISETSQVVMTPTGPQRMTVPMGQESLSLSQVDRELQKILNVKKGMNYTSNDHILSLTREETANAIGDASKKVSAVRRQFAPEYQAKNELTKIVQPFNRAGEFDTTKGIKFFSDYASGNMTDPDQLRLIDHIIDSKKLGADIVKPLQNASAERNALQMTKAKLASDQPSKVQLVQEKYSKAGKALVQDHENHLSMLDAMKQMAIKDESNAAFKELLLKHAITGAASSAGAGAVATTGYGLYKAMRR